MQVEYDGAEFVKLQIGDRVGDRNGNLRNYSL